MPRTQPDQAEGLRRLLERSRLRVLSVSSGAGGSNSGSVINLAGALVELGSDVLILDANPAARGLSAALGLEARFDLEDVIRHERDLDEVIVRGPAGILILPLARGAHSLARLPASAQQRLVDRCGRLGIAVDTLLVDAVPESANALLRPGTAARELIVLAGGSAAAITSGYALIKRLSGEFGRREFHVLVSEVASETQARAIFANMARVARRYLQVSLDFIGHIPPDDKLRHAARLRLPVVAAFPGAAAAQGFRRVAQAVAGWPGAEEDGSGFDDFMSRLIHASRLRTAAAAISL